MTQATIIAFFMSTPLSPVIKKMAILLLTKYLIKECKTKMTSLAFYYFNRYVLFCQQVFDYSLLSSNLDVNIKNPAKQFVLRGFYCPSTYSFLLWLLASSWSLLPDGMCLALLFRRVRYLFLEKAFHIHKKPTLFPGVRPSLCSESGGTAGKEQGNYNDSDNLFHTFPLYLVDHN